MKRFALTIAASLAAAALGLASSPAWAGDCCAKAVGHDRCDLCGAKDCGARKVCRLVREVKEVEVTCWASECEQFCIPGPSTKKRTHCEQACTKCDGACDSAGCDGQDGLCAQPKRFVWTEWCPGKAFVRSKKNLMRKTVIKKVPTYRWVVEDVCTKCEAKCDDVQVEAGAEVPPVPETEAKVIVPEGLKLSSHRTVRPSLYEGLLSLVR